MSERYYKQQMDHFNIKSVAELGQFHRGEIVKRGKRSTTVTPQAKAESTPRRLKADVLNDVNKFFQEPIPLLKALTVPELENLEKAIKFHRESYGVTEIPHNPIESRTKAPYIQEVLSILALPPEYTLDLTKLTVAGLKDLIQQLCKGLTNEQ